MARIRIEDLPVRVQLTPEEMELLWGAGRRPAFRPQIEGLEDRFLLSASALSLAGAPAAPALTASAASATQINLAWNRVAGASGYVIDEWVNGAPKQIVSVDSRYGVANVTQLNPGSTYYFDVAAVNGSGTTWSGWHSATTFPAAPSLGASAVSPVMVSLSWNPVAGATGYVVDELIHGAWQKIGAVGSGTSGVTVSPCSPGTTYTFAVGAANASGTSWSYTRSVTTPQVDHPAAKGGYLSIDGTLFGGSGPSFLDVQQGIAGDCWLMASFAAVAARVPGDITSMFTHVGSAVEDGSTVDLYSVRFFDPQGAAHSVVVDTELPGGGMLYDHPTAAGVFWAALGEKAYVEANALGYVRSNHVGSDSYSALDGGDPDWALQAITGRSSRDSYLNTGNLAAAWNAGLPVVLDSNNQPVDGYLVGGHAHALVGYNPSSSHPFEVYNPWGQPDSSGMTTDGKGDLVRDLFWANAAYLSQNFHDQAAVTAGNIVIGSKTTFVRGASATPLDLSKPIVIDLAPKPGVSFTPGFTVQTLGDDGRDISQYYSTQPYTWTLDGTVVSSVVVPGLPPGNNVYVCNRNSFPLISPTLGQHTLKAAFHDPTNHPWFNADGTPAVVTCYGDSSATINFTVIDSSKVPVAPVAPVAPTYLHAHVASPYEIDLDWNKVDGADGYRISYTQAGVTHFFASTTNTSIPVMYLKPNTTYQFEIKAYNTVGSNSATIPDTTTLNGILATVHTNGQLEVLGTSSADAITVQQQGGQISVLDAGSGPRPQPPVFLDDGTAASSISTMLVNQIEISRIGASSHVRLVGTAVQTTIWCGNGRTDIDAGYCPVLINGSMGGVTWVEKGAQARFADGGQGREFIADQFAPDRTPMAQVIQQGNTCSITAALAAAANEADVHGKSLLDTMPIRYLGNFSYEVDLYDANGNLSPVNVKFNGDPPQPGVYEPEATLVPSQGLREFWTILYARAFIRQTVQVPWGDPRPALAAFTGRSYVNYSMSAYSDALAGALEKISVVEYADRIMNALDNKQAVAARMYDDPDGKPAHIDATSGLCYSHSYTVVGYTPGMGASGVQPDTITLRNPWGSNGPGKPDDHITVTWAQFLEYFKFTALPPPEVLGANENLLQVPDQTLPLGQGSLSTAIALATNLDQLHYDATAESPAYSLKQSLGLHSDGNLDTNWGGEQDKWIQGNGGQWYYLLPGGQLYQWDNQSVKNGTPLAGSLIATLDSSDYQDPSLLYNAQPSRATAACSVDQAGHMDLNVTPAAGFSGRLAVTYSISDAHTGRLVDRKEFVLTVPWSPSSTNWTASANLGGPAKQVVVGRNLAGNEEMFAIAKDNTVWHRWQAGPNSGSWSNWVPLGGSAQKLVVANDANGALEVCYIGTDNAVWHVQENSDSSWNNPVSLKGYAKDLAVGTNADGRLEVFYIGSNNAVWHRWQTAPSSPSWSAEYSLGGPVKQVAVGRNLAGNEEIFAIANDNTIWHLWQAGPNSSSWSSWVRLGGSAQKLVVANDANGALDVFYIGTDNAVWHVQENSDGSWNTPVSLGGYAKDLAVGKNADGRLEVFYIGNDNAVWHRWQTAANGGWSNGASLGGSASQITLGQMANGALDMFGLGLDSNVWHRNEV